MEWLKELNQQQLEAVLSTEGPLLVLAGAGSGKTRVITYRIAYILNMGLAKPSNILAITFTNKAADEMKERIKRLVSVESFSEMWVSTFHSACARILRMEAHNIGFSNNFIIFDMQDRHQLLKECFERLNIDEDRLELRYVSRQISNFKNMLISPSDIYKEGKTDPRVAEIYKLYNKLLKEYNAFDFDDLLYYTIMLFRTNPDILEKYQQKFRYILVDEYQDTNYAQFYLIYLLAQKHRNICVVGDDDQSIYSFRGANVRNILEFEKVFNDAKVIKLEKNYRSTKTILSAANEVIKNNIHRKPKRLWTENSEGEKIYLYPAFDEVDEANFVSMSIKNLIQSGIKPSEIGVLYRTNAQSLNFENALSAHAIPYKVVGSLRFFERKEVKDILAYLRLIVNPHDNLSLFRVINVPKRGIGPSTVEKIKVLSDEYGISAYSLLKERGVLEFDRRTYFKLNEFVSLLEDIRTEAETKSVVEVIKLVLDKTKYMETLLSSKNEEDFQRAKNLEQLISAAAMFEEENEDKSLQNFLNSIALSFEEDDAQKEDKVMLMTVHAAKGLEFDVVFLTGLEEGLFPLLRAEDTIEMEEELEEERRLCYVAITRAKKFLVLTYANNRRVFGRFSSRQRSCFVDEIPAKYIQQIYTPLRNVNSFDTQLNKSQQNSTKTTLAVGDIIQHNKFGIGKILSLSEDLNEVLVDFEKYGQKRLLLSYANLKKIG
ncbi:ATP-dependent helicase [Caldicellulosiruptor naganoensis]|uniref:DNA 3'-5' helicase n=1 Tax=Caldicellulosiruptor naganoensis TaxID=29324 RepID=A0ABY7BFK2_9FIRM|nr:UvrD-helicase domain-containing protein [Caldicellulosiruptor naganoensis]WAM30677.1 UvrD-helicase domain-containing protein [Caldicellulosiruptor naganoensis]